MTVAERPPRERGLPVIGHLLDAWKNPLELFMRTVDRDVVRYRIGPLDYVLLSGPDAIRHVLVDNARNYTKSRNYIGLKLILGEGLLTSEGERWRKQRKLAQPAFHRASLGYFVDVMRDETERMLRRWDETSELASFDVHHEMMRLTFAIVGRALFSVDLDSHSGGMASALEFGLRFVNEYAESFVPPPLWVPTRKNRRFNQAKRELDELVYGIIEERRRAKDPGQDLLGLLLAAKDEDGAPMGNEELRDEVVTMVLAGHETTANLLSFAFYLLSKNPAATREIRSEAARELGDAPIDFGAVAKLGHARRVIDEVLRLYPPAWVFERQAIDDDVADGAKLLSGDVIGIAPFVLHRRSAFWQNPEGFDPDRFLPEKSEGRPRYAYLPFGGGPRTCIGNSFALTEAVTLLVTILRRYELSLVPVRPLELEPLVTLRPKGGIWMGRRALRSSSRSGSRG